MIPNSATLRRRRNKARYESELYYDFSASIAHLKAHIKVARSISGYLLNDSHLNLPRAHTLVVMGRD